MDGSVWRDLFKPPQGRKGPDPRSLWLLVGTPVSPVNQFNHTSWVVIVTPTDRPKSVRNRCVIEVLVGGFVLSRCFLDFSVGVWGFVIEMSQISSFFSYAKATNNP